MDLRDRLIAQGMSIELTPEAREHIAKEGTDPVYGARPLRRAIQTLIEDPLSEELLGGSWHAGDIVLVGFEDGKITFSKTTGEIPKPRLRTSMGTSLPPADRSIAAPSPRTGGSLSSEE